MGLIYLNYRLFVLFVLLDVLDSYWACCTLRLITTLTLPTTLARAILSSSLVNLAIVPHVGAWVSAGSTNKQELHYG